MGGGTRGTQDEDGIVTGRKGDRYRSNLTHEEKSLFVERCKAGTQPTSACPLCGSRRLTTERRFGFCETHWSWETGSVVVDCHRCAVRYGVLDSQVSACLRREAS